MVQKNFKELVKKWPNGTKIGQKSGHKYVHCVLRHAHEHYVILGPLDATAPKHSK